LCALVRQFSFYDPALYCLIPFCAVQLVCNLVCKLLTELVSCCSDAPILALAGLRKEKPRTGGSGASMVPLGGNLLSDGRVSGFVGAGLTHPPESHRIIQELFRNSTFAIRLQILRHHEEAQLLREPCALGHLITPATMSMLMTVTKMTPKGTAEGCKRLSVFPRRFQ
jgi:hypothetical protein